MDFFHGLSAFFGKGNMIYVCLALGLIGFYFLNKGLQQINKETQQETGQTNIIYSIILLLIDAFLFWYYFIK